MMPPLMSSTLNMEDVLGNKDKTGASSSQNKTGTSGEKASGRPEKPDDEKSDHVDRPSVPWHLSVCMSLPVCVHKDVLVDAHGLADHVFLHLLADLSHRRGADRNLRIQTDQKETKINRKNPDCALGSPDFVVIADVVYAKNSSDRVMGSMYLPSLYTRMLPEAISSMSITSPFSS